MFAGGQWSILERRIEAVGGEIARGGRSCNISIARQVNRNPGGVVRAIAAEIGRIHQRRAGGIKLCDKAIRSKPAGRSALIRTADYREVRRSGRTGHISVSR